MNTQQLTLEPEATLDTDEQYAPLAERRRELYRDLGAVDARMNEIRVALLQAAPERAPDDGDELLADLLPEIEEATADNATAGELRKDLQSAAEDKQKIEAALRKLDPIWQNAKRQAERRICASRLEEHKAIEQRLADAMTALLEACRDEQELRDELLRLDCEFRHPLESIFPLQVAGELGHKLESWLAGRAYTDS